MISQRCPGCRGPLVPSRARWWEWRLARMTSRRPFRCAYCHKRCRIISDGSEQPPQSAQEIAAWPTRDVSLDLALLDSLCSSGLAQVRHQTAEVPMHKAGDADCEVIISISSSPSTAAVTSLRVRRPHARATWSRAGADGSKPSRAATSERQSPATRPTKEQHVLRGDELHLRATRPAH